MNAHPYYFNHLYNCPPKTKPQTAINNRSGRRERTSYNEIQLKILENVFKRTQHPDVTHREQISAQINVSEGKILIWFKNRRAKERQAKRHNPAQHRLPAVSPGTSTTEEEESPPPPPEPTPPQRRNSDNGGFPMHTPEFPTQPMNQGYPQMCAPSSYAYPSYPYPYPYEWYTYPPYQSTNFATPFDSKPSDPSE